jgi:molecular chaperone GrpE
MRMSEQRAGTANEPLDGEEAMTAASELVEAEAPPDPHSLGLELPDDPDAAIGLLLTELSTTREEAGSYLDDLRRVAADFDNYRKRTTRESSAMLERATEKVVRSLMPVLDTFDAALGAEPKSDTERQLYSGMLKTREQLLDALKAEGLEVIPTLDEEFDPEIHEPVGAPEGNGRPTVSEELRRGYRLNGKVLRAALVALEASE